MIKVKKNGRVVGKKKLVVYGELSLGILRRWMFGNFSGVLCERVGRLVGGSECFSKVKRCLVCG
ncbi:MAG: hypothetical protein LBE76_07875 [Nitrososphaerota archaeon]|nr:hypothetical protein [Nitrososphaerota archaeon]